MNRQAQIGIGALIVLAITLIIGAIFVQVVAQEVGGSTSTIAVANQSETLAANGESIYIEEYKHLTDVVILDASDNSTIAEGNYTVTNNVINPTTNALSVKVTTDDAEFASNAVRVSGTAQPLDYISDSGGRAMANLIIILFALSIAIVALIPSVRSEVMNMMNR
ncbi:MAG: hypothetical protein ACLFPS_05875 [Clostridia bacterium]